MFNIRLSEKHVRRKVFLLFLAMTVSTIFANGEDSCPYSVLGGKKCEKHSCEKNFLTESGKMLLIDPVSGNILDFDSTTDSPPAVVDTGDAGGLFVCRHSQEGWLFEEWPRSGKISPAPLSADDCWIVFPAGKRDGYLFAGAELRVVQDGVVLPAALIKMPGGKASSISTFKISSDELKMGKNLLVVWNMSDGSSRITFTDKEGQTSSLPEPFPLKGTSIETEYYPGDKKIVLGVRNYGEKTSFVAVFGIEPFRLHTTFQVDSSSLPLWTQPVAKKSVALYENGPDSAILSYDGPNEILLSSFDDGQIFRRIKLEGEPAGAPWQCGADICVALRKGEVHNFSFVGELTKREVIEHPPIIDLFSLAKGRIVIETASGFWHMGLDGRYRLPMEHGERSGESAEFKFRAVPDNAGGIWFQSPNREMVHTDKSGSVLCKTGLVNIGALVSSADGGLVLEDSEAGLLTKFDSACVTRWVKGKKKDEADKVSFRLLTLDTDGWNILVSRSDGKIVLLDTVKGEEKRAMEDSLVDVSSAMALSNGEWLLHTNKVIYKTSLFKVSRLADEITPRMLLKTSRDDVLVVTTQNEMIFFPVPEKTGMEFLSGYGTTREIESW